jgi:putative transposase
VNSIRKIMPQVGVGAICEAFGRSRQAFYKQLKVERVIECEEQQVISLVREVRRLLSCIGGRKLYFMLKDSFNAKKIGIGRDRLFDILRKHRELHYSKHRYAKTTDSTHCYKKYPDVFNGLEIVRPEQAFVSDITYIPIDRGFVYASFVTDAFSHQIMGFQTSKSLDSNIAVDALIMALGNRKYPDGKLIHHSDRGVQYCSNDYTSILKAYDIVISMTETGDPRDNAIAERVNGIIKNEFGLSEGVHSFEEAQTLVSQAVLLYNTLRPHMSCNMRTPSKMHLLKNINNLSNI